MLQHKAVPAPVSIVIGGRFHAFDLARELHRRGALHRLITNYPKFKTRQFGIPNARVASMPTILLQRALERTHRGLAERSYELANKLFGAFAARHLDGSAIVHGWSGFALDSFAWAKRHGACTVVERSSSHILTQIELLKEEFDRVGMPWRDGSLRGVARDLEEYEAADLIAVPSLFAKRTFLARGFDESRLLHAPFGASLDSFNPGPKADAVFRVIFAGQLSVRKGIHYLVQGFEAADIPNSELCLVGAESSETPTLLRSAGSRVRRLGHLPQGQLNRIYQSGSLFAMASIEEGLATVQAQAMAAGLPLICTTNTGGEDLLRMSGQPLAVHEGRIDEYPAGFVVPIRDPEAIAVCLRRLAHHPDVLRNKRENALAIRGASLGWDAYAQRVLEGYARLA